MEIIHANIGKMEAQLERWGTKLEELLAKAAAAGEDVEDDSRERIDELVVKHQAARARLDELAAAGSEKWETLKDGVASAWDEIETAFKKLKN